MDEETPVIFTIKNTATYALFQGRLLNASSDLGPSECLALI